MASPAAFTAMCAYAYHLPPFVELAVGSSISPPSSTLPVVASSRVHSTAVWDRWLEGSPTVCAYQMEPERRRGDERICESWQSTAQGVTPHALAPERGGACGRMTPPAACHLRPRARVAPTV